jgi:RND family efflux transporter MFP subunit
MKKIIVIISLLIVAFGCKNNNKQNELQKLLKQREELTQKIEKLQSELKASNGDSTQKVILVEISEIKPQEFNHYIEVQGKVDGEDNIYIAPKMSGIVTAIYVKEGDAVKKGQVLAQIDDAVIKQSIEELQTQLNFANNLYNKQKNLWEKKIGSEVQYLTAKNNKEALEKKMATLNEQLSMAKITAPISGTIEEVGVKVGQVTSPAPNMPAFRMVNFSKIKVTAEVAEAYSPKVRKGDKVYIKFPDFNEEIESNISFASKYINPTNRTFTIESRLNSGKLEFRANMIALVKINDYKNPKAFVIPVSLIQKDASGSFVFVAIKKDNKLVSAKKYIKTGMNYNGNIEITEGLSEGDLIITTGFQNLEDGEFIKTNI